MTIKLNAATGGGSVSLSAPNSTTSNLDVELTLPVDDGTSGQFLQTNGSGTLSFADASSDSITEGNTTVECVDTGSDGHITFDTEGSEAARFDSSQRLLLGTTTNPTTGSFASPKLSLKQTTDSGVGTGIHIEASGDTSVLYCGYNGTSFDFGTSYRSTGDNRPITFSAAATERMRIDTSGRVMISSTSHVHTGARLNIRVDDTNHQGTAYGADSTSGRVMVSFNNPNGEVGYIVTSGTTTGYNTSSDYRLKENVVDLDGAIDRVKQLAPKRFNFIADASKTVDGFLAHEAQTVVPEAVYGTHNEVEVWRESEELPEGVVAGDTKLDEDGNPIPKYQGIDQSKLVPLLTAALQEAIGKIEALETANASLEARLTALEGGAS